MWQLYCKLPQDVLRLCTSQAKEGVSNRDCITLCATLQLYYFYTVAFLFNNNTIP